MLADPTKNIFVCVSYGMQHTQDVSVRNKLTATIEGMNSDSNTFKCGAGNGPSCRWPLLES